LILWRILDGECEIVIEVRHALPLICTLAVLIVHLSGATSVTASLLFAALIMLAASAAWA